MAMGVLGATALTGVWSHTWTRARWRLVLLLFAALVLVAQVHASGDPIDLAGVQVGR